MEPENYMRCISNLNNRTCCITDDKPIEPMTGVRIVNSVDGDGNPAGGSVRGVGISINWQNGPSKRVTRYEDKDGNECEDVHFLKNGAFVEDALIAAKKRLEFFQSSTFGCAANAAAIEAIEEALEALEHRRQNRIQRDVYGTHEK